jgi:VIT1/CCC1 family predicted Fe2+/Mn2+ transporter
LVAFVVADSVSLLPFVLLPRQPISFALSVVLTFATLFAIGGLRAVVTIDLWWRAGFEMLLLGVAVALAADGSGACAAWLFGDR